MSVRLTLSLLSYRIATINLDFDTPSVPDPKILDTGIKKVSKFWTKRLFA